MKALILCLALSGCATERYMTLEQDAEFKANCEQAGCVVVPVPIMMQLLERLKGIAASKMAV